MFNLIVNTSNERSQVSALHVPGEVEQFDPRDKGREVLGRGKVCALSVNNDGVPVSALECKARKVNCAHSLTYAVQIQRGERVQHMQ